MPAIFRNIESLILNDLEKKFVFLSGPRQVGKTTLAQKLIRKKRGTYLSYDADDDRRRILGKDFIQSGWVCLDEFHKFPRWKNFIKGIHDKHHAHLRLLLTGSARLDVFQKSGDSLFGRYFPYRLHPLSVGELAKNEIRLLENVHEIHRPSRDVEALLKFGGFPEPFLSQSAREHLRWSNLRRTLLVKEELRELTEIKLIGLVEQLMLLLPEKIGSMFSYRSLSEDIRVSVPTIQTWMETFEKLFIVFRITPFSKNITRSIQKQPKYYFWDWSQINDPGARFENFIGSHLWKAAQLWTDLGLANVALHFVRDRNGREVDFLLTKDRIPWILIEVKLSETRISESLRYFCRRLNVPGIQLLAKGSAEKRDGNITIVNCKRWLGHLL